MKLLKKIVELDKVKKLNNILDKKISGEATWVFQGDYIEIDAIVKDIIENSTKDFSNLIDSKKTKDIYWTIRVATKDAASVAGYMHYDSYRSTVLVPLKLPNEAPRGDLNIWENSRRHPKYMIVHLFQKVLIQSRLGIKFLKTVYPKKFIKVTVKPGDTLRFNGFLSLHFNDLPSAERRSLLLHFDREFDSSILTDIIERYSRFLGKANAKTKTKTKT